MKQITYEIFFKEWKNICKQNEQDLFDKWDNCKEYTSIILNNDKSITQQIAELFGLSVLHEYYFIDAVFYDEKNDVVVSEAKNKTWTSTQGTWLKNIEIAFEHENHLSGARGGYQEICHLLTTRSKLKILVGYAENNSHDEYAEDFQSILVNDKDVQQSILFILGYMENDTIKWKGYILETDKVRKI